MGRFGHRLIQGLAHLLNRCPNLPCLRGRVRQAGRCLLNQITEHVVSAVTMSRTSADIPARRTESATSVTREINVVAEMLTVPGHALCSCEADVMDRLFPGKPRPGMPSHSVGHSLPSTGTCSDASPLVGATGFEPVTPRL